MKTLYSHFRSLSLLLLCSATVTQSMEPQEDKPITWAQTYYGLSKFLIKDIVQLIFSFHLDASGIDYKDLPDLIKQSCTRPDAFIESIDTFLKPENHTFAAEIFERAFAHEKISICDIKNDSNDWNVLHDAVREQHLEIVKIILNIAGDKAWMLLTTKTKTLGRIPLHLALNRKDTEIIKLLMKAAGDKTWTLLTMENNDGWTALHYAVNDNSTEMVKLLLDAAGDNAWTLLTTQAKDDNTALHYAALNNNSDVVELLLNAAKNNAQELMDIQNCEKKTTFYYAGPQAKEVMEKYRKNIQ